MKRYIVAVHIDYACENLYFLVEKEIYEYITGQTFSENILIHLTEIYADNKQETLNLKSKFERYFTKREILSQANLFAHLDAAKVFGYTIYSDIHDFLNYIIENKITIVSNVDVIVTDDSFHFQT